MAVSAQQHGITLLFAPARTILLPKVLISHRKR
jgi:hypothetical protein